MDKSISLRYYESTMARGDTLISWEEKIADLESLYGCERTAQFADFLNTSKRNDTDPGPGYSANEVHNDKRKMKEKQRGCPSSPAHARFFENVFGTIAKDWFGPDARITRTAEYDDEYNGADYVIEWQTPTGIVRLKVDLTTENDFVSIKDKITPQKRNLVSGQLGQLKYFKSSLTPNATRESLMTIPEVLLPADKDRIHKLVNDLDRGDYDAMRYLRREFIMAIKNQMEDQMKFINQELQQAKHEPRKTDLHNALDALTKVRAVLQSLLPQVEKLPLANFPKTNFQKLMQSGKLYATFSL